MSTPTGNRFVEAVLDLLAAQWAALGLAIDAAPDDRVVDPEPLILITATLADRSPRMADVSVDWCVANGRYLNVSRLRRLYATSTPESREAFTWYAARVRDSGGPSWPMAGAAGTERASRGRVQPIGFQRFEALLLRLRALVGVNARAEVLLALAAASKPLSVRQLAARSGYTRQNILGVVEFLSDAGIVGVLREGRRNEVLIADSNGIAWLRPDGRRPNAPSWFLVMPLLSRLVDFVQREWRRPAPISTLVKARALELVGEEVAVRENLPRPMAATGSDPEAAFESWLEQLAEVVRPRSATSR